MTKQEAYRLLHPETSGQAIKELEYYQGFSGKLAGICAIEAACLIACECIDESIKQEWWKPTEHPILKGTDVQALVFNYQKQEYRMKVAVWGGLGWTVDTAEEGNYTVIAWKYFPSMPKVKKDVIKE